MNNDSKRSIYYIIFTLIILIFFGIIYLILNNLLFKDKKINYKQTITLQETINKVDSNNLIKYDLSNKITDINQNASYIFINEKFDFEIVYINFLNELKSNENYLANLANLNGKHKDLIQIKKIDEKNYSKYTAEDETIYVAAMKIGTANFLIETSKQNKKEVEKILSQLEK